MAAVLSPCINVCTIHPVSGLCVGCRRTLTEIAQWASLSDQDRGRVMADLPRRSLSTAAPKISS